MQKRREPTGYNLTSRKPRTTFPIEQRLAWLEKRVFTLYDWLSVLRMRHSNQVAKLKKKLRSSAASAKGKE
jgi:hypothetical protein